MTTLREEKDCQRLDTWLWCVRVMKTRSACARFITQGGVRLNRQRVEKPAAQVRPGDVLTLSLPAGVRVLRVLELAQRRRPASEARALYEEIAEITPAAACTLGQTPALPCAE